MCGVWWSKNPEEKRISFIEGSCMFFENNKKKIDVTFLHYYTKPKFNRILEIKLCIGISI